ncbi:MAG: bifunctional (p)ppGpp synthetase/guanosine-3',5'-bis(diphosphate) 3'-pyrophosphohydrolase [Hyphomicrobium sp.]|nr:bifunctional (p)ppGpp synthetase/guanosine-3',5'-bis(diphosphate) 3'-pyrophosphohydrolase [Hyphomicrobium sp.]
MKSMPGDVTRLTEALVFAADAHRNQRRKGAAQEPYINHLIEVLDIVARSSRGANSEVLVAAILHDVVEDTPLSYDDVAKTFGPRVATIVRENSDDMSLPKDERRRARMAAMPHKSTEARIVKMADVISNLRAVAVSPPAGWGADRKLGYLEGCRQLIDAGRGADQVL